MNIRNPLKNTFGISFLTALSLTLLACGGGGSPSNGIPASTVTYTGTNTQATVDNTNSEELTTSYIAANKNNYAGVATSVSITNSQNNIPSEVKYSLFEKLKQDAITAASTLNQNSTVAAVTALTGGNCASLAPSELNLSNGTLSQSILSQTANEVVVKISYNNLCQYNSINSSYTILNGDIYSTVSGNFQTGIIDSLKFIIPGLSVTYVDLSTTPSQSFTSVLSQKLITTLENYDADGFPTKITFIDYTDVDSNGTVYRFENITVTDNNVVGGTEVRFYNPTFGWIVYEDNLVYNNSTCINGIPVGGDFRIITSTTTYVVSPNSDCTTFTVTTL